MFFVFGKENVYKEPSHDLNLGRLAIHHSAFAAINFLLHPLIAAV